MCTFENKFPDLVQFKECFDLNKLEWTCLMCKVGKNLMAISTQKEVLQRVQLKEV